ncbi:MAG: hypothetical protein AB7D57_08575 [Desulfovibrionaceae bacterium]
MSTDPLLSYLVLALLVVAAGLALLPFLRWRSAVKQNRLLEELLESQRRTNRMLERLAAGQDLDPRDQWPGDLRPGVADHADDDGDDDDDDDSGDTPRREEDDPWPPSTGSR